MPAKTKPPRLALKKYGWSNQVKSDLRGEVIYNFIVESSNEEDRQEGLNFLDQHMKDRKDIYGNTYTWLK